MTESVRMFVDNHISVWASNRQLDHRNILLDAGFYPVYVEHKFDTRHIHEWCIENIGYDKYNWVGKEFWFENEDHAVLFALKWT